MVAGSWDNGDSSNRVGAGVGTVPPLALDALADGEFVVWRGRTTSSLAWEPADYFATITGIAWLVTTPLIGGSYFMQSSGIVLIVAVAFWLMPVLGCALVMLNRRLARSTSTYVLTNRRAMIVNRLPRLNIRWRMLAASQVLLSGITPDGTATLNFVRARFGEDPDRLDIVVSVLRNEEFTFARIPNAHAITQMAIGIR